MSEIALIKKIACETCVSGDTCSHRIDLPGIARICDRYLDRTLPDDVQAEILTGDRCHVCAAPSFSHGGQVTCGACLFAQAEAKRQLGDRVVKVFHASFSETPVLSPTLAPGADPDEIEEED